MNEVDRIRLEYSQREQRLAGRDIYSGFNLPHLYSIQQRQRMTVRVLRQYGIVDLSKLNILEMGCGSGGILAEFLAFGAFSENLYGIDLLFNRLAEAYRQLPGSGFANANGGTLPFRNGSFDLVLQYTAISSVLDPALRRDISAEMLRVLRPGGLILSYDFWLNPTNPQTRGLKPREIHSLFPDCQFTFKRITLAPPIARRLASFSWGACLFLESLKFFNSHYLVAIRPISNS